MLISIILFVIGIKGYLDYRATNYLEDLLENNPIVFSELNNIDYVTNDIQLKTYDAKSDTQIYWKSKNGDYISNYGQVNRPAKENQVVEITAYIKHQFGTGRKSYKLTVIKNDVVSNHDIYKLNPNDITYNRLLATYDDYGYVLDLSGSFGNTQLQSVEDVLQYLDCNKTFLQIEGITCEISEINSDVYGTQFVFQQYYSGLPIFDKHIVVNVDKKGNILSISLDIKRDCNYTIKEILTDKELLYLLYVRYGSDIIRNASSEGFYVVDNELHHVYKQSILDENKGFLRDVYIGSKYEDIIAEEIEKIDMLSYEYTVNNTTIQETDFQDVRSQIKKID